MAGQATRPVVDAVVVLLLGRHRLSTGARVWPFDRRCHGAGNLATPTSRAFLAEEGLIERPAVIVATLVAVRRNPPHHGGPALIGGSTTMLVNW